MATTATKEMKGVRKAAVLLVTLGPDVAGPILKKLDDQDVERLTLEVFRVERVTDEAKDTVLEEFFRMAVAGNYATSGGTEYARQLLTKAVGDEKAGEMIDRLLVVNRPIPFDFLKQADPQFLLGFLQGEHPQTVALVLSHLPTALGGQVITGLSPDMQGDVARRVALMGHTTPEVIENLENVLRQKLTALGPQEETASGGVPSLVKILTSVDQTTEKAILAQLDELDRDLSNEIRKLMFVFEDLIKVDDRGMQRILRDVDFKDLALALRNADDELKQHVSKNLSTRAAATLKEEMDLGGPARRSQIEEAQQRIIDITRRLEESGEVIIVRDNEDSYV